METTLMVIVWLCCLFSVDSQALKTTKCESTRTTEQTKSDSQPEKHKKFPASYDIKIIGQGVKFLVTSREANDHVHGRFLSSRESLVESSKSILDIKTGILYRFRIAKQRNSITCSITERNFSDKLRLVAAHTLPTFLSSFKDAFGMTSDAAAEWIGTETIRNTPSNCWMRCGTIQKQAYKFKNCFSRKIPNLGSDLELPVRMEITIGKRPPLVYDVISFKAGSPTDESIFYAPIGQFCTSMIQKPFPQLPDVFQFSSENVISGYRNTISTHEKVSYNKKAKVLRKTKSFRHQALPDDLTDSSVPLCSKSSSGGLSSVQSGTRDKIVLTTTPQTNADSSVNQAKDVITILDFSSGINYVINTEMGVCNITTTADELKNFYLENPVNMIVDKRFKVSYQGKKWFRHMPVHSWSYKDKDTTVHDVLFYMPENISKATLVGIVSLDKGSTLQSHSSVLNKVCNKTTSSPIPLKPRNTNPVRRGFSSGHIPPLKQESGAKAPTDWIKTPNPRTTTPALLITRWKPLNDNPLARVQSPGYTESTFDVVPEESNGMFVMANIYNFDSAPDLSVFDVSQCFKLGHQYKDMKLKLYPANYRTLVENGPKEIIFSLHEQLCTTAKVQRTRISRIQLSEGSEHSSVLVKFRIFAVPVPTDGTQILTGSPSLREAYGNLLSATASGLSVKLKSNFPVMTLTLYKAKSESVQALREEKQSAGDSGYSTGTVTGVGMALFLTGSVLSAGVIVLMYKLKRKSPLYLVTA